MTRQENINRITASLNDYHFVLSGFPFYEVEIKAERMNAEEFENFLNTLDSEILEEAGWHRGNFYLGEVGARVKVGFASSVARKFQMNSWRLQRMGIQPIFNETPEEQRRRWQIKGGADF